MYFISMFLCPPAVLINQIWSFLFPYIFCFHVVCVYFFALVSKELCAAYMNKKNGKNSLKQFIIRFCWIEKKYLFFFFSVEGNLGGGLFLMCVSFRGRQSSQSRCGFGLLFQVGNANKSNKSSFMFSLLHISLIFTTICI